MSEAVPDRRIEHLLRELAPQVLGAVIRRFRDFSAAEDAMQESLIAAALQWPREGLPENPRAWLIQVALRRMTDYVRREEARRRRETEVFMEIEHLASMVPHDAEPEQDDTLILLFMCCHPALTQSSAIALTLRAVGGLTTGEIAKAFLVPEATMAQRISRAKQTIRTSGVPFRMPTEEEHPQRLRAVLHVLYLIFNEGYVATEGAQVQRLDLAAEAIRMARALHTTLPADPEVQGLLALMLLTDSRSAARTGPGEAIIPLSHQDRELWDQGKIGEGVALVTAALSQGRVGQYQLQAAIAAVHAEAPSAEATDWPQIVALYEVLKGISDNPVVRLNHAIAVAMVDGPAAGLHLIHGIEQEGLLPGHHRIDAVRAHLQQMQGNHADAIENYRLAASRTASMPERNYLLAQAAQLESSQSVHQPEE